MTEQTKKNFERTALATTRAIGSPTSIAIHTVLFVVSFATVWLGYFAIDRMLLILTTLVSLEAIYLSLFIQMTVNYTTQTIEEVESNIDEIQEDIEEMQEDVEEMSEEGKEGEAREAQESKTLEEIHRGLQKLMQDVERLQHRQ